MSQLEIYPSRRSSRSRSCPSRDPTGWRMLSAKQEGTMADKRDPIADAQTARSSCMMMLDKIKRNGVRPDSKISKEEIIGEIVQEIIRLDRIIRDSTWRI